MQLNHSTRAKFRASLCTIILGLVSHAHAESTLTLYGILDTGLAYQANSRADGLAGANIQGSQVGVVQGIQSGNRWGLQGSESLGNGYNVNFVLENGFNLTSATFSSSNTEFNRQAWLELAQTDLGRFRMGRQYNFAHSYFDIIDPFKPGSFIKATMGASFGSINTVRMSNSISYETSKINGFQGGIGYSFALEKPATYGQDGVNLPIDTLSNSYNFRTNDNLRALTAGVRYESGPLYISAIYDSFYPNSATASGDFPAISEWVLGAAYTINEFKVSMAAGQTQHGWINPVTLTNPAVNVIAYQNANGNILFDPNMSVNSYMVGFETPAGSNGSLFGSWQMAQPSANMLANTLTPTSSQNIYSLAYTHKLSPRTNIYVFTSYSENFGMVSGLHTYGVGVGMRHKF